MSTANNKAGRISAIEDQISGLPEPIIHHILSLLETRDGTRTSILSKKWRSMWYSFPIWDFNETSTTFDLREGHESRRKGFINFVDESLQHRLEFLSLQKIRLCLWPMLLNPEIKDFFVSCVDRWISLAIERKVQELDLKFMLDGIVQRASEACFSLPQTVIASKSVNTLRLEGCKLKPSGDIGLSFLKTLCLEYVFIDDLVIQHLLSSCPLIEFMSLKHCRGLLNLQVRHLALKTLIVECREEFSQIMIDAPNLETLTLLHKGELFFEIISTGLINLSLVGVWVSDDTLHELISNQPLLENLNLVYCAGIGMLKVYNQNLKTVMLYSCNGLVEADFDTQECSSLEILNVVACVKLKKLKFCDHKLRTLALCGCNNLIDTMLDTSKWSMLKILILILCHNFKEVKVCNGKLESLLLYDCNHLVGAYVDAPKLVSFEYIGKGLQFSLMNTSSLLDAKLWLYPITSGTIWLDELICLLRWFGHGKVLTLVSNSWQNMIIPKEMRENFSPPLYDLKHLKLKKSMPSGKKDEFLNSLFLNSHLKSLSRSSMDFMEIMKMLDRPRRKKEPSKLSYAELVDSALWSSPHLGALSIDTDSADLLLKFQYKSIENEEGFPLRWQKRLKEVQMENFEATEMELSLQEFLCVNGEVLEEIKVTEPLEESSKEIKRGNHSCSGFQGMNYHEHLLKEIHDNLLEMPQPDGLEDAEIEELHQVLRTMI